MDIKVNDQNPQPPSLRRPKLQPNMLASHDEAVPPEPALFSHVAVNQLQHSPTQENALGFAAFSPRPPSPPELSPRSQMAKASDELQEVIDEARLVKAQVEAAREKIRNARIGLGRHCGRRIPRPPESTVIEEVTRPLSQNSSYKKLPPISSRPSSDTSSCSKILPPIRSRPESATSFCSETLPPIRPGTESATSSCSEILPPIRPWPESATSSCSEISPPIMSQPESATSSCTGVSLLITTCSESTMSDETLELSEGSATPEGRKMADISSVQAECKPRTPEAESSTTSLVTTPCPSEEYHVFEALCQTDRKCVKKLLKMKHVSRALFGSQTLEIVNWVTTVSSAFVLPAMVHYQTTTEGLSLTLLSSSSAAVSYHNPQLQSLRQIVYFCSSVHQQSLLGNVALKLEEGKSPQTPTTALFLTELEGEDSLRLSDIEEQEEEPQTARSQCSIGHSSSRSTKAMAVKHPLRASARHVLEVIQRGQAETSGDQQAVLLRETILQVHQRLSDTGPVSGPAHQKMGHLLHLFHLAAVQSRLINALGMSEQTGRSNDGDHRRRKDGSSSSSCEEDPVRRATPGEAWGAVGSSGYSPAGSRWSPVSALSLREQRQALEVLTRVLTVKVEDRLKEMCEDPEKAWDTVLRGGCLASMNNPSADVTIREEEPSTSPALGIDLDQSPAKATSSHSLSVPVQPGVTGDAAATHRPETESVSDDESDEDEVKKEEEETVIHQAPHFFIVLPDSYKDFPLNDGLTASDSNSDATESPGTSVVPGDQENGSRIPPQYNYGGRDVDSTDIDEDNPMTPTECDRELRSQSPSSSSSSEEEVQIREELLLDVPRATAMRRLTLKNVIHGVMTALSTGGALRSTNEEDHLETEKILLKKVRVLLKRNAGISVTCNKQEVSGHFKSFAAVNRMIQSASKELLLDWNTRQLHPTRRGVAETLARVILEQGGRCVIPHDYYGPCDLEDDLEEEEEKQWYDSFWKSPRPPTELDKRYGLIQFSQSCSSSPPARNTQISGRVNSLAGLAQPSWTPVSLKNGDCYTEQDIAAIKVAPSSNVSTRSSGHSSTLSSSTGSQKKALNSSRRPSQERASLGFPRGVDCLDTQMTQGTTGQVSDMRTSSKTKKKGMAQVAEEGKGKRQKNGKNNADLLSSAHATTKEEEKVKPKTKPTLRQRFKSARKSFRLTLARIFCCGPPV